MQRLRVATLAISALMLIAVACPPAVLAASTPYAYAGAPGGDTTMPRHPFSGLVEGTFVATSTSSITIMQEFGRGGTASSTQKTFTLMPQVRTEAASGADASSTPALLGQSVVLVLEHAGVNIGKVMEIRFTHGL